MMISGPPSPTIQGRVIAFVDAGFLTKAGETAIRRVGDKRPRKVDGAALVAYLRSHVMTNLAGGVPFATWDFVRAYWYDGAYDPVHPNAPGQRSYHEALAEVPGLQLRLGHLKESPASWERAVLAAARSCGVTEATFRQHFTFRPEVRQKGVDTRLVLDLLRGAQTRAFDDAIVITGDDDISEAVSAAQDLGRRITLAHPEGAGVARSLRHLVDGKIEIPNAELVKILPPK